MTWPAIPPEYEGKTWDQPTPHGVIQSPFPPLRFDPLGPPCDEFLAFQNYAYRQLHQSGKGMCRKHGRFLSYREGKANACFWCMPWMDTRRKRQEVTRDDEVASEPSEVDDAAEVWTLF